MPDMCINHPNKPAMVRCKQCHKPVCDECSVSGFYGTFCSTACQEKFKQYKQREEQLGLKEKRKGPSLIVRLIIVAVILVAAYFGFKALLPKDKQQQLIEQAEKLKSDAKKAASKTGADVKDAAGRMKEDADKALEK